MKLNEAVTLIKTADLLELTGSEKQVSWATDIRKEYIAYVRNTIAFDEEKNIATMQNVAFRDMVRYAVMRLTHPRTTQATYWIDERRELY